MSDVTIDPKASAPKAASLLWWDIITPAVLLIMGAVLAASTSQYRPVTVVLAVISLVAVGALYVLIGRESLRRGMRDDAVYGEFREPGSMVATLFLALLVLLVGLASSLVASFASLQALAYPMIWVAVDSYRRAVGWSAALAASVGIGSATAYLRSDGEASPWVGAVVAIVSFAFAVAMGTWISRISQQGYEYRQLAERLRASQQRVAELSAQAGAAAERERMSRELHDTLTQTLTGLVMLSEQAQRLLDAGDTARTEERLARVAEASRMAMAEARALVATTQPLGDGGLVQAIGRVAERLRLDTGLEVVCELQEFSLDRELQVVILRAAQEGLANARKHAQADRVTVSLRCEMVGAQSDATNDDPTVTPAATPAATQTEAVEPAEAVLRVEDDGIGPEAVRPGAGAGASAGFGLAGLAERLRLVGGRLRFEAGRQGGSVLEVRVPIAMSAKEMP